MKGAGCAGDSEEQARRKSRVEQHREAWASRLGNKDEFIGSRRRTGSDGSALTDSNATGLTAGPMKEGGRRKATLALVTGNGGGRGRHWQYLTEDHTVHGRNRTDIFLGQEHL